MTRTNRQAEQRQASHTDHGSRGSLVRFRATLRQAEGKNATGIIVPDGIIERLGHGKRPPVRVSLNGYEYRSTVGVMRGVAMLGVSAAIRQETRLSVGEEIDVELVVDTSPREIELPDDFDGALAADATVRAFFDALPNSLRRYHVNLINAAKGEDTRRRRIEKAVANFRAGKQR